MKAVTADMISGYNNPAAFYSNQNLITPGVSLPSLIKVA